MERLTDGESGTILTELLRRDPQFRAEAEEVAEDLESSLLPEDIATDVCRAITWVDLDALNERSGSHSWGYLEPIEAAWELLDEVFLKAVGFTRAAGSLFFGAMSDSIPSNKRSHEAYWPKDLFEKGIGWIVVARFRSGSQRIETGVFLLDVACLGVKQARYDGFWTPETYQSRILDHYFGEFPMEPVEPCCARKLVEHAVRYAGNLGFSPHPDYRAACRVWGGIRAEDCSREFSFGREGKPFYVSGPNDSEERSRRIVEQLARRCGAGNFDYLVALDSPERMQRRLGE